MTGAIVTDIEGTTSSLAFVKDVLFPYARERLPAFVTAHGSDPNVRVLLDEVRREAGERLDDAALIKVLLQWIEADKKITALKSLQGLIWEAGYRNGELAGHIYDDAYRALTKWRSRGIRLYVFSSGSVKAQQLLFGHTGKGDLRSLFEGYFDTTTGAKKDPQAYRRIVQAIGFTPKDVLFLSDIEEELDAARAAGMRTCWVIRGGEAPAAPAHPVARNFDEIEV